MLWNWFSTSYDEVKQELDTIQRGMKHAFRNVKREFDDHLNAINQNTSEIQSVYDYLSSIDRRLDKLQERVDEMQMYVNPEMEDVPEIELTLREQEVFFVLYTESDSVSCEEIGRRLGFTTEMVNTYVYNMISKGVPVVRDEHDGEMQVGLDNNFRTLQAKKEIIPIDQGIRHQFNSEGPRMRTSNSV